MKEFWLKFKSANQQKAKSKEEGKMLLGVDSTSHIKVLAFTEFANSAVAILTLMNVIYQFINWATEKKKENKDPFLIYYFLVTLYFVIIVSAFIYLFDGEVEAKMVFLSYASIIILAVLANIWRKIDLDNFTTNPKNQPIPIGYEHKPNYVPPILLLANAAIIIILMIYMYGDEKNKFILMYTFFMTLIVLGVLRVVWQFIDMKAAPSIYEEIERRKKLNMKNESKSFNDMAS